MRIRRQPPDAAPGPVPAPGPGRWLRPAVLVALVAGSVIVGLRVGVPPVEEVRAWVTAAGWAGPVLYAALYAALSLTPVPASLVGVAAGVLFGLPVGLAVVVAGAMIGAVIAFGAARNLGRGTVERLGGRRIAALDELVRRRGLLAVIAVRLVPLLPFTSLNLACGLTAVRRRDYVIGTAIGILPAATAYVTIGAYGATPGSVPFLVAVGGLVVLAVGGLFAARRRAASTPTGAPPTSP